MWLLKVLTQFVLAQVPFGESINHRLQRLNSRAHTGYESKVRERMRYIGDGLSALTAFMPIEGSTVVEIGTGWDALPTLMLYAAGADRIYTYDHVRHLRADLLASVVQILTADVEIIAKYVRCSPAAVEQRLKRLAASETTSLSDLLDRANIIYQAPGDATGTGLPAHSVDLYYSFAVLLHVPDQVAEAVASEARRVLRLEGIYFAAMGLQDQYSDYPSVSEVNFLKYPEWLWALLVKNKISYTNRLRESDFLAILERHGATFLKITSIVKMDNVRRVKSMKIAKRFAGYTPEDLATTYSTIIAGWPGPSVRHAPIREQRETLFQTE